jgi:hypothetical protein
MDKVHLTATLSGRRYTTVDVKGISLRLQSLTALELSAWKAASLNEKGEPSRDNAQLENVRLVVACVVDESGNRVFDDKNDLALVSNWDADVVAVVALACSTHILLPPAIKEKADDLAKN